MEIVEKDLPQLIVALDSLDTDSNYIHILDAKDDKTYYCPCCKGIVKPRAYKQDKDYQVQAHYYHETGGCNEETFIHYICKNWLFEKGCKFIVNDVQYEVENIEIEKTLHTSFGDYRSDIIVATTSGKVFYFEIKTTNRKSELYAPKWDELGNDVVEVDTRYFINQKYKNDVPVFNLIYSDGKCFIKSYSRNDYEDIIAKRKLEWKRQDKLNYKIQWERLDWFWKYLQDYKNDIGTEDDVLNAFNKLNFEDKFKVCEVVKKMNCLLLYSKLHNIVILNFKKEIQKLNSKIVNININNKKNCKNIILIHLLVNYNNIDMQFDLRKITFDDFIIIKDKINAIQNGEEKFIKSYNKLTKELDKGKYEIDNGYYGFTVYSLLEDSKKRIGYRSDSYKNITQGDIDYFFECIEEDRRNHEKDMIFQNIKQIIISNQLVENINYIIKEINPYFLVKLDADLSIQCLFIYKDISCNLFTYKTIENLEGIELNNISELISETIIFKTREYNNIVSFNTNYLDLLINIRDKFNNCKNKMWHSSIKLEQNNYNRMQTEEKITTSVITLWIELLKDGKHGVIDDLIISDNNMLFRKSDAYKTKDFYETKDSEWKILSNEEEILENVENIMTSLIFQYRNKFDELLIF